jgi:hypothetical protein
MQADGASWIARVASHELLHRLPAWASVAPPVFQQPRCEARVGDKAYVRAAISQAD